MTIPATTRKAGPLLGNGSTTSFPFTFKIFAASDITVTIANNLGTETVLVLNIDYTVTLNGNQETSPGGTVTYPISGTPLPSGGTLTITGNLPYDQPLDLPSGGNFSPLALENELDRLTMQLQQLAEEIGRALRVSVTTNADVTLPAPAAGNVIGWNESGTNLNNYPIGDLATGLAFATYRYDTFTGDGSTTQYTLSADPVTLGNLDVAIGGVTQIPGVDYTLTSGVLEFTSAPPDGASILARFGEGVPSGPSMDSYDVRFKAAGSGSVQRTVEAKLREFAYDVKDFGAVGDGVTDDTAAIVLALTAAIADLPATLYFPKGEYRYSDLGNLAYEGLTIRGDGSSETVLRCINTTATFPPIPVVFGLYFFGYPITGPASTRANKVNLQGLTIEGNASTHIILGAQGVDNSQWYDVNVRVAKNGGIVQKTAGFTFIDCIGNTFERLVCSDSLSAMSSKPEAGIVESDCKNNLFISPTTDGLNVGIIAGGTCSVYVNVSCTNNSEYGFATPNADAAGMTVTGGYIADNDVGLWFQDAQSTAIGLVFDNNTTKDMYIRDGQVINCTCSNLVEFYGGSRTQVTGGNYADITIESGHTYTTLSNLTSNGTITDGGQTTLIENCVATTLNVTADSVNANVIGGGFAYVTIDSGAKNATFASVGVGQEANWTDNGTNTQWINLYDLNASALFFPYKDLSQSASGTAVNFTDIPAGTRRITVMFQGVSTNGSSLPIIQLGDSGGYETTGYLEASSNLAISGLTGNYTDGFAILETGAANVFHGTIVLDLVKKSTNAWVAHGVLATSNGTYTLMTAGSKSLSATLDRLRVTTQNGTDAYDAGTINVRYE